MRGLMAWKMKIFITGILILLSAGSPSLAGDKGRIKVFVSIVPQKYFVEKIGGDLTEVSIMIPPGASPHSFEPKPRQMAALSEAKIYFAIGVEFEAAWLKRIAAANRDMLIVQTQEGIKKIPMKDHFHDEADARHRPRDRVGEDEGGKDRDQGVLDPHVWVSPPLVMVQARNILKALQKRDPSHASVYEANYRGFITELEALHAELQGMFREKQGARFMVFHPVWGYFARDYGLEQIPVEIEGKDPKPAQLQRLITEARTHGVKAIIVQPEFSIKGAEVIARAIGGKVVVVSPLAPEWEKNLREAAARLKEALW